MKITDQTPGRITVAERPWFLAGLFVMFTAATAYGLLTSWSDEGWGVRAVLVFWVVMLPLGLHYFVHWVRVDFDRMTGRVDISRRGLLFERRRSYPLKALNEARLQEMRDEGVTSRIVLIFDEAMLAEMDPAERERLARLQRQGFRQAAPNEVPLTGYFSGISNDRGVAEALNNWLSAA